MTIVHGSVIAALWVTWLIYWAVSAFRVKPTRRGESVGSRLGYMALIVLGAVLMTSPDLGWPWLHARFVPRTEAWFWCGAALLTAGLGFSVWARIRLGRNWSGTVTLKEDHELIRGGPYAWTRHPIYSGLLLALFGNAVAIGEWRGLVALVPMAAGIVRKMAIEERFMLDQFGEAYTRYRREVPALVPFLF